MVDKDGNFFFGLMNVIHNWEGIKKGNFFESVGKGIYSYFAGEFEGIINLSNAAWNFTSMGKLDDLTGGYIKNLYGKASTWLEVTSHNIAFDKPVFNWNSPEWTEGRKEHSYYAHGSLSTYVVSLGIDLERLIHGNKERTRYSDIQTKRLKAINGKWEDDFSTYHDGGKRWVGGKINSQMGHKFFGIFLRTEDWYYGFELYGEPTEKWSKTDLQDDTKYDRLISGQSDEQFNPPEWYY